MLNNPLNSISLNDITTSQLLLFLGGCLLAIVSFFLRDLYTSYQKLHERVNDIERKGIPQRLTSVEHQMKQYDKNIEEFWKEFPKIVTEAIAPHLQLISSQLEALNKRIDKLEESKK